MEGGKEVRREGGLPCGMISPKMTMRSVEAKKPTRPLVKSVGLQGKAGKGREEKKREEVMRRWNERRQHISVFLPPFLPP
jgi:hypothetical protein